MRTACIFALALLVIPFGVAQDVPEPGEPIRVLTDASGDYRAALRDGPGIEDPIPYYEFMDMEWLDVLEDDDGFTFTIKVVDIEGPLDETIGFSDGGYFWIHFTHNDWNYRLELERPSGQLEITYYAVLQGKFQDADEWGFLWRDDDTIAWDSNKEEISMFVSREDLADSRGSAPHPGRTLTDFYVLASQRSSSARADFNGNVLQFPWVLQDRMPDTGIGENSVPVQFGLIQSGDARLISDEPYRASNGEATTFLYTVTAANLGESADLYALSIGAVPNGWDVELPLAGVSLGPGENLTLPVLVSTPFAHLHGGTASFVMEMRSTTDASSVGRLELGVRYLEIPQPAGHHDAVFLHSIANTQTASFNSIFAAAFQPSGSLYFNTVDADDNSDEVAVSAFAGLGLADFTWLIPLDPTLRLGLDVDMESLGETLFEIQSPAPMQDASLTGALIIREAGSNFQSFQDAIKLATFEEDGLTFAPNGRLAIAVDMTPHIDGDYVPYDPSNELWIRIDLTGTGISAFNQNTVPRILPGGSFRLPLLEYEDDISDAFDALSGAAMKAVTQPTRSANPGDIILFEVDLTAGDAAAGMYQLDLTGQGTDWARIVSEDVLSVSATPARATVMVEVPSDATGGERGDVFLQAINRDDPQRRGIIRLVVNVDTENNWDDDRNLAVDYLGEEEKGSPSPAVVPLVAALAATMIARRRRA